MNPGDEGLPARASETGSGDVPRGNPRQATPEDLGSEWFARKDQVTGDAGLRFGCTMCGNCCSGPEGYVLVSDGEAELLARELGIDRDRFLSEYTCQTREGRSLLERETSHGKDCIFLDRTTVPGKAICGVYEARPAQCRTWPFWPSVVESENAWRLAGRVCPGIGKGNLHAPQQIRIQRDAFRI